MMKCIVDKWERRSKLLGLALLEKGERFKYCYKDLVALTFKTLFNEDDSYKTDRINIDAIVEIDNGDYQGTLMYVLPFDSYQPSEYEYLMTYVGYGSCSGCDTLQAIQDEVSDHEAIDDYMALCKDIFTNTIKPYNANQRYEDRYSHVELKNIS